jgi:acyl carrier protein
VQNGNVARHIHEFILKRFPLAKKRNIGDSDELLENGIFDSLGILDVVSVLEKDFSILISDEEMVPQNFRTVATIAAFVANKQVSKKQTA